MRPAVLMPLFAESANLPGVGKRLKETLARLCGPRVKDLLFHLPASYIDRRPRTGVAGNAAPGVLTSVVTVDEYRAPPPGSRRPFKVICKFDGGYLTLVFFNTDRRMIEERLPLRQQRAVSGRTEYFDGMLQMAHPDYIVPVAQLGEIARVDPVYPLTAGISQRVLGKIMRAAVGTLPDLPEWLDSTLLQSKAWPRWKQALAHLHTPNSDDTKILELARERLAYDEILANQLALALSRRASRDRSGQPVRSDGRFIARLRAALPYKLTAGQEDVLAEIRADMESENRMLRLLQGDVGSGKTIVALCAILNAAEAGKQSALMVPTDLLSRQHVANIGAMLSIAGLEKDAGMVLLTGHEKGRAREEILARVASGDAKIVIGTHALFQEGVEFDDLALVVIDEQHRFGVRQRLNLSSKGEKTDLLLMTATPIPRTLALTFYGDMDVSSLTEKPAGRQKIRTSVMPVAREGEVITGLKRAFARGERAYWVCPLIEENPETGEGAELAAAESRHQVLRGYFGDRAGLVHGRMKPADRDRVMLAFRDGGLDILVATTVIEVGVDVPEATIIVIEQAERFGLAQIHQLRGRVGRGQKPSSCVLLYGERITENASARLKILRESDDGFRIAEEDLRLRGSGEVLGTKQSGLPEFTFARLPEHGDLLFAARDDTKALIARDPHLLSERGKHLRTLLYLFEYESHIKYLMSG